MAVRTCAMTPPKAVFSHNTIVTENSNESRALFEQGVFGSLLKDGRIRLSLLEAAYLLDTEKITVIDGKNNPLTPQQFEARASKIEKEHWLRAAVFNDLRSRGYIVKTALKFGADFRVYDKGVKPGEDHARWIVYPVHEKETMTWHDFSSKNRVAHSTRKRLLIAVVDDEGDVSYWESRWLRP